MPIWARWLIFFVVVFGVFGGIGWYVHRRASQVLPLRRRGRWLLALAMLVGPVALIGGRLLARSGSWSDATMEAIAVVGSAISLAVVLSGALLVPVDVVRGVARLVQAARARWARRPVVPAPAASDVPTAGMPAAKRPSPALAPAAAFDAGSRPDDVSRRSFLSTAATGSALALGGGFAFHGAFFGRHGWEIEELVVPLAGLPRTLDGFTLVQLSDIHVGTFIGESELRAAVDLVRQARADAVVLTGDLVDHDPHYAALLGRFLRRLTDVAPHGVYAIPGNHDHYAGVDEVLAAVAGSGATPLVNAGRRIGDASGGFALLGVEDLWAQETGGPDLDAALAMVDPDQPKILLAHQPVYFELSAGRVDLQLSGHTHGGQVQLGVNPAEWVLPNGWVKGQYERAGSRLYVNRGFGTAGPPTRIGSPPEVTRIVLTSA